MNQILDQQDKNFHIAIRQFKNGIFEAVTKLVKPMSAEYTEAIVEGKPVTSVWDKPIGFTNSATEKTEEEKAADRRRSHNANVNRSKKSVRWLCKSLGADRLLTLTYRENMEDRERLYRDFTEFLRLVRKAFPDWVYVAVPEKQDRGALHIHLAVKGWQRINFLRKCWYIALGGDGNEKGEATPGGVNITPQKNRWGAVQKEWKVEKLAGYISKYIHKTFEDGATEKKRYWSARGIDRPVVRRMWVAGSNMFDAIKSTLGTLYFDCGLDGVDFDWWLSPCNSTLWIGGRASV